MDDLRRAVHPVEAVADLVGEARLVLLGESTHGTRQFYELRAALTRHLVARRGFRGVALEADWPAGARVDRYVQRAGGDAGAVEALGEFRRFPRWMWRNPVVADLVEWLRESGEDAGVYGLDLYSLRESMSAVVEYLDAVDPEAAARARRRYGCFDHFDEQAYGHAAELGAMEPCEDAVVAQLSELRERAAEPTERDGRLPRDAHFLAEQNARLVANAEQYYRSIFRGRSSSWNLRDTHMADTLDALVDHLGGAGVVVWAHNSHLGDARATSMGLTRGEVNLGQLARERHGGDVCIVGFSTHTGTVTAAHHWDGLAERRRVRPSLPGSVERRLHDAGIEAGVLDLRAGRLLDEPLLQRMIGVIYRPERSARATTSRPGPPASTTYWSTSTRPPRWSRWTAGQAPTKARRRTRQASDPAARPAGAMTRAPCPGARRGMSPCPRAASGRVPG